MLILINYKATILLFYSVKSNFFYTYKSWTVIHLASFAFLIHIKKTFFFLFSTFNLLLFLLCESQKNSEKK